MSKKEDSLDSIQNELSFDNKIYEKIELESPAYDKDKKFLIQRLKKFSKKHFKNFEEENLKVQLDHNTLNSTFIFHSNQNDVTKKDHITSDLKITTNDEGNKQINNYIILDNLGKGSYGTVKMCYNLLDEKYYVNLTFI